VNYQTIAKCEMCGKEIDVLSHPEPKMEAIAVAFVLNDSLRDHRQESPGCMRGSGGWTLDKTTDETTPKEAQP
jgi:hypothetical protein